MAGKRRASACRHRQPVLPSRSGRGRRGGVAGRYNSMLQRDTQETWRDQQRELWNCNRARIPNLRAPDVRVVTAGAGGCRSTATTGSSRISSSRGLPAVRITFEECSVAGIADRRQPARSVRYRWGGVPAALAGVAAGSNVTHSPAPAAAESGAGTSGTAGNPGKNQWPAVVQTGGTYRVVNADGTVGLKAAWMRRAISTTCICR